MKQSKTIKLSDAVTVESRFGRSVNLERDFYAQAALDGFILTTAGRSAFYRFMESFANTNAPRAWTLTGPFGSGKSAFAFFLAKVLGCSQTADVRSARELLKQADENLWRNLFDKKRKSSIGKDGLLPVLVSGSRESLATALLCGLKKSLDSFEGFALRHYLLRIAELLRAGESVNGRHVVELFIEVSKQAVASRKAEGLLIVIDELGKLLEYAAYKRDGDIFLLQELAEATESNDTNPIFLLTILHQSFGNYIEKLGRSQQEEWMKIQGRFEDVAFLEPTEQILRLVNQAVKTEPEIFQDCGRKLSQKTVELGLADWLKKENAGEILSGCLPLHPTVALILGHLFRRVAQNDRSLFAFLTSAEPFGFQDFLAQAEWSEKTTPLYRLDNLYDYITTALGSSLYAQTGRCKWAEIETVLNRMNSATELEINLAQLRCSFLHIEALAFEINKPEFYCAHKEVIRLGVTTVNEPEGQRVLIINRQEESQIEEAKQAVDKAFQSVQINGNRELRLAVLAKISRINNKFFRLAQTNAKQSSVLPAQI